MESGDGSAIRVRVSAYLAGRGLGEREVDLGLDGETDVVCVDGGLGSVVGIDLGVGKHIHDIAIDELQELVHHSRLVLALR